LSLIDTDVIIWHMRGNVKAKKAITSIANPSMSIVTQMELVQGLRNKDELSALHRFVDQQQFMVLPLTEAISQRALFLMEEWRLSHGLLMADAMIGATAIEHGLPLLTANSKHYVFLPNITVKTFAP